jgi:subtilisin family serine protease
MFLFKTPLAAACAAIASAGLMCAPAALAQAKNDRVELVIGHKAGGAAAVRAEVVKASGRVVHDLAAVDALVVEMPRGAAEALVRNGKAEFVEPPIMRRIQGQRAVRALPGVAQSVPYGIPMVQADQVRDAQAGNRTLCIVDSGIDASHEDLAGVPMTGENFTKSGQWYTDENSHGTHVAGTVAALGNAIGVVGVAPSGQLKLHIAKVFDASGSATTPTITRAMLSCWQNGAHVVSMSLGGDVPSQLEGRVSTLLAKNGLLLIAAAGNDGNTATSYPAGFPEVMSVAAIDSSKMRADFSQVNPDVEIAAPGVGVLSTVPAFSQTGASLAVGGSPFTVLAMEGSPLTAGGGALANFELGTAAVAGSMNGKVCLIQRGSISFAEKVVNCQASGGAGAVVYNNTSGELSGTLGGTVTTIPSVGATQADGATLLGLLGQPTNVAVFQMPDV